MKTPEPNVTMLPIIEPAATVSPKNNSSVLNALSPADQEQLLDWLEIHPAKKVLELVAAPRPEGFGIKTHITSLRRFHHRSQTIHQKNLADSHLELLSELGSDPRALTQLTDAALRQFAVQLSTIHNNNPSHFAAVSRWVLRLQQNAQRDREIKAVEDRIALENRKFEFNAARAAILHMVKIKEILSEHPGDSEDKIWACRDELFGPRSDLIENPNMESAKSSKGSVSQPGTAGYNPQQHQKPNTSINQQSQ